MKSRATAFALAGAAALHAASLSGAALAAGGGLLGKAASPGPAAPAANTASPAQSTRYWYDGGVRRELSVDPDRVADFRGKAETAPLGKSAQATGPLRGREEVGKSASGELPAGVSPVLREAGAPPGQMRALPGGVIVTLRSAPAGADPIEREAGARQQLQAAGLAPVRALDPSQRTWLVESATGLASLELANRLHESGAFEQAAPNWWRPRALK